MQVNTISKGKFHCFLVMVILFISIFLSLSLFLIRLADDNFNKNLSVENSTEGRPAQCQDGFFPCKSNKVECIPQWEQCNQVDDCEDGSDEDVCFNAAGATTDIFKKIIESNKTSANDFAWLIPANCDMDRLIEDACPCNLTDVNVIICSQSNLTEVPNNLVATVFKIGMSKNFINSIDHVHWPGALKSLALDGNNISEIGEKSFESAPNLSRLYLSNNKIEEIHPLAFEHSKHLAILNLDSNRLRGFSSRLIQGKNSLRSLNLTDNQLDLDQAIEFSQAPNIEEIFLEQNQITTIRRYHFSNLTKLTWLTLANNRIEHIEDRAFENDYALTELNLAFNRIKVIDRRMFARRLNIHKLYLDGNPIELLPVDAFRELLELRSLNLTQIEFGTLQRENFNYLALLKFIYFEHFAYCYYAPNVRVCRPITDGISTGDQLLASLNLKYAVWVVAVVCSLGNIIVLIWRSISKHEDEALSLFVRNLSVADLMMGLYLCTIAYMDNEVFKSKFRQYSSNWLSSWTCSAIGTLAIFSSELSVFLLTIITIERYRAIVSIKRFESETFMRRARLSIALAWFLSFLIALYPLLDWILQESSSVFYATNGLCLPLHIDQPYGRGWKYSALVYVFINFSAVMLMICLYARMYIIIIGGHQTAKPHLLGGERREEAILAIRFFFIVITDCLCWIPIVVIKIIAMKMTISSSIYGWLVVFIIPINSALNPIVYTLANPNTLFCRLLNRINNRLDTFGAWLEATVEASWQTITRLVNRSRALVPSRSRSVRVPRGSDYSSSRSSNSISNGSEAQLMNNIATSGGRRRTKVGSSLTSTCCEHFESSVLTRSTCSSKSSFESALLQPTRNSTTQNYATTIIIGDPPIGLE